MQLFLYLLSKSFGDSLVKTAFFLAKPQHLIDPDDISSDVGAVLKHPTLDAYAWCFTDDLLLIHPDASKHTLDVLLQILVDAGRIPLHEIVETQNVIDSKRGGFATILEILPGSLSSRVKTVEQMEQEGWFQNT